jgi:hypothetical protein
MGNKYEIAHLRDEAIRIIGRDLRPWNSGHRLPNCLHIAQHYYHIKPQPGLAFDMVNLLHETNLPRFLPAAYIHCARRGADKIVAGTARADGSIACLSLHSIQAVLAGRDRLISEQHMLYHQVMEAARGHRCYNWIAQDVTLNHLHGRKPGMYLFRPLNDRGDVTPWTACGQCWELAQRKWNLVTQELWRKLPEYFRVSGLSSSLDGMQNMQQ